MKLMIPAEKNSMDEEMSLSFGRASGFILYDTDAGTDSFIENPGKDNQGGAGIKAAQAVIDSGAEVLLSPHCGTNAADVLKKTDIRVFSSRPGTVRGNVELFLREELSRLF